MVKVLKVAVMLESVVEVLRVRLVLPEFLVPPFPCQRLGAGRMRRSVYSPDTTEQIIVGVDWPDRPAVRRPDRGDRLAVGVEHLHHLGAALHLIDPDLAFLA